MGSHSYIVAIEIKDPPPKQVVFATTKTYSGNLLSPVNMDSECEREAQLAGLTPTGAGGSRWAAILSWSHQWATHITNPLHSRISIVGAVVNTRGELVAWDGNQFWGGAFSNPIRYDAFGNILENRSVWTGSFATGEIDPYNTCSNWSSNSSNLMGNAGSTISPTISAILQPCNTMASIYCIKRSGGAVEYQYMGENSGWVDDMGTYSCEAGHAPVGPPTAPYAPGMPFLLQTMQIPCRKISQ